MEWSRKGWWSHQTRGCTSDATLGSSFISQSYHMHDRGYFVLSILPSYYIQWSCRGWILMWPRCVVLPVVKTAADPQPGVQPSTENATGWQMEVLLIVCHGDKKSWIYFTHTDRHRHRRRHMQRLFSKEVLEETAVGLSGVPYSLTERWGDVFSASEDACSPFWILLNLPVL